MMLNWKYIKKSQVIVSINADDELKCSGTCVDGLQNGLETGQVVLLFCEAEKVLICFFWCLVLIVEEIVRQHVQQQPPQRKQPQQQKQLQQKQLRPETIQPQQQQQALQALHQHHRHRSLVWCSKRVVNVLPAVNVLNVVRFVKQLKKLVIVLDC
jgi:hypothetical protein